MYSKGALMLNTLRNVIANDSLFFNMLKGMQEHFRYQSINTEMLVSYINKTTNADYTAFFHQYLNFANIPELQLKFARQVNGGWSLQYRWNAEVKGFAMPVSVTKTKNKWSFIYPTGDWQQLELQHVEPSDFKIDTENFYIKVKKE
jgi:aminopeptidase N